MQGVPLNIDTFNFEIRKFHYFVRYDVFILETFLYQKLNSYLTHSCKYLDFLSITFVAFEQNVKHYPHHLMQILVLFETDVTCIWQNLPDACSKSELCSAVLWLCMRTYENIQ